MLGIAVFAILVSMAAPQFTNLKHRQEMKSQEGLLRSTLAYARNEAISRRKDVYVCGTANGASCVTGKDWSAGWLVYIDENSSAALDSKDTVLKKTQHSKSSKARLMASSASFYYNDAGEAGESNFHLMLCAGNAAGGSDEDKSRTISVNNVGSTRVAKGLPDGKACP